MVAYGLYRLKLDTWVCEMPGGGAIEDVTEDGISILVRLMLI